MNKTKFYLEKAAAIVSIVCCAILCFGAFALLVEIGNGDYVGEGIIKVSSWVIILASIAIIIVDATLCMYPTKDSNGNYNSRMGRVITLIVVNIILAILEISGESFLYGIIVIVPVVLLLISLSYKHTRVGEVKSNLGEAETIISANNSSISTEIANLKKLRDEGVLTEDQYMDAVAKLLK